MLAVEINQRFLIEDAPPARQQGERPSDWRLDISTEINALLFVDQDIVLAQRQRRGDGRPLGSMTVAKCAPRTARRSGSGIEFDVSKFSNLSCAPTSPRLPIQPLGTISRRRRTRKS